MIVDCFLVNDEIDLVALRIEALCGVVDQFIAVMGDRTFQGAIKPQLDLMVLRGWEERLLFSLTTLPEHGSPWLRETEQRNSMAPAIAHLNPPDDAVILLSDVDELPRPEAIPLALQPGETGRIGLRHCVYFADLEQISYKPWLGTRFVRFDDIRQTTPQALRGFGVGHTPQPGDTHLDGSGGVHLSFLGGVAAIQRKLQSWAHAEANRPRYLNPDWLARCLREGLDWQHERDLALRWVEPDGAWPQPLLDHPERYADWWGRKLVQA